VFVITVRPYYFIYEYRLHSRSKNTIDGWQIEQKLLVIWITRNLFWIFWSSVLW